LSVVLFHTGKRYGDIVSIAWTDVIRAGEVPTLLRIVTKGAKHEDVPLPDYAAQALQEFYGMVQATRSGRLLKPGGMVFARSPYVFASRNGLPLRLEVYNQHLRSAGTACGVGKVSSHIWRHSLATYLLNDQRRNLREVQEILGHVRLETTARYTHIQAQARRDILSSICLPTIPS
jgi:integrase/recombinase XerC